MKNKKKIILLIVVLIILVALIVLALVLGKKDNFSHSGQDNVISTLEGDNQAEIDEIIKKDLEENDYGLDSAKVYINPYGSSPLSALIAFKTEKDTKVKITVKGKHEDDITLNYDSNKEHYIPVFGLYENYENKVVIELDDGTNHEFTIKTSEIEYVPTATVNSRVDNSLGDEIYFISSPITMQSFAFDKYGELRWITSDMYYHDIVPLENGHLLIGTYDMNTDALATRVLEIDYLGRIYNEYNVAEGYLNDIYQKEDGNLILASKNRDRNTFSDYIIEIDKETGKIVKSWDVYKLLEQIDPNFTNSITRDDYFYNSGIEYYEDTDSLLLTYWGGEFVIDLDYTDGVINWIFANPDNLSSAFKDYLLVTTGDFTYPKSMHSASLSGNTLKVFDNGYSTNKNDSMSANLVGSYSSANTYKIDGKNISLVNSIDEDKKYFSYALGDYEIVDDTHELILFGRELKDLDYSANVDINQYDKNSSRLLEKVSGTTALDMTIDCATYNVVKVNLNGNYTFDFTPLKFVTTLEPSEKEEITSEMLNQIKNATESVPYEFGYSNYLIESNVLFMSSDEAKLILVNDNDEGAAYTLKVKDKSESETIVTDLPNGKYYIYVYENGVMYTTSKYIEIK